MNCGGGEIGAAALLSFGHSGKKSGHRGTESTEKQKYGENG
jgi:hypothetical protein